MAKRKSKLRFVRTVLISLLLILLGACIYYRLFWHLPVGEGPAGPTVPGEAFEQSWTDRPVLFLGVGDSMTTGFGAGPGMGYFARLEQNHVDEFAAMNGKCLSAVFPNLSVLNVAVSGSTSLQAEISQLKRIPVQNKATLGWVVITTGGNDIIHNYGRGPVQEGAMYGASWAEAEPWIENYRARLDRLIAGIESKFPGGCQIFLANIYDPTDGVGDIEDAHIMLPAWPDAEPIHTAYNKAISECAEKHSYVHLVDIYSMFLGHGIHCRQWWNKNYRSGDPHYWYYYNLEDPNHRGYDAMRRQFLLKMIEVAKGLSRTDSKRTSVR